MSIAQQKLNENVAEYVLYVWQMQDLLRSFQLNGPALFEKMGLDDISDPESEERNWLTGLAQRIKSEGIEKKGNTTEINTLLAELFYLHNTLLSILKDAKYAELFQKTDAHLNTLMEKSGGDQNLIEHMLIALYGWLILRMQKKEISPETTEAMTSFSRTMAYLSDKYKKMKTGELNSEMN